MQIIHPYPWIQVMCICGNLQQSGQHSNASLTVRREQITWRAGQEGSAAAPALRSNTLFIQQSPGWARRPASGGPGKYIMGVIFTGLLPQKCQTPAFKLLLTSSGICHHLLATKESNFTICQRDLQQQLFALQAGASRAASPFAAPVILHLRGKHQKWADGSHISGNVLRLSP